MEELDKYTKPDQRDDPKLTGAPDDQPAPAITARAQQAATTATSPWLRRQKKRDWLAAHALYLANHRTNIGYTQYRPVDMDRPLTIVEQRTIQLDCSSMVIWLYARGNANFKRYGGLPDPGGYYFTGWGNTYSMESRGKRVDVPAKGDCAFYDGHVAIVVRADPDQPWRSTVVSHGSQLGPLILHANYRGDLHGFRRYFG